MGLQIDDAEVSQLLAEVSLMAGETETKVLIRALQEHRDRLRKQQSENKAERVRRVLEEEVWPLVPPEARGRAITKAEREEILGYGPDGV
jgi:antitoxin VapB